MADLSYETIPSCLNKNCNAFYKAVSEVQNVTLLHSIGQASH